MPYSMDSDQNKENPIAPSPVPLDNQIVYKIASLEATITNSLRRLDEKFDRMQTELHDRHIEHSTQFTALRTDIDTRFALKRARVDALERDTEAKAEALKQSTEAKAKAIEIETARKFEEMFKWFTAETKKTCERMDTLEKWQTTLKTQMITITAGIVVLWTLFGRTFQDLLEKAF